MFDTILEMFSYPFMVKAMVVGILISVCSALLGVSLVLKRYSMIGDGLSHVGFGTLAFASAINVAPLYISIPIVIFTAFLLLRISENSKIKSDSAIALISASALAIGVMIVSMTTGLNTDMHSYLFGSILGISTEDVILTIVLAIVVVILFIIFYNKIFAITFDENFAKATGVMVEKYKMLIATLTALVIVLGMRTMGALLISSLVIFPALTSMRICKKFKTVIINSVIVAIICFIIGTVMSYIYGTPTGASVVVVNIILFAIYSIIGFIMKINI